MGTSRARRPIRRAAGCGGGRGGPLQDRVHRHAGAAERADHPQGAVVEHVPIGPQHQNREVGVEFPADRVAAPHRHHPERTIAGHFTFGRTFTPKMLDGQGIGVVLFRAVDA